MVRRFTWEMPGSLADERFQRALCENFSFAWKWLQKNNEGHNLRLKKKNSFSMEPFLVCVCVCSSAFPCSEKLQGNRIGVRTFGGDCKL